MGRFSSPDYSDNPDPVPFADFDDPQSLNLYAYVGNNPLVNIDVDGHGCQSWWSITTWKDGGGFIESGSGSDSSDCRPDYSALTDFWHWGQQAASHAAQAVSNAAQNVSNYLAAPRDPGCIASFAGIGAGSGAVAGGTLGAIGGGLAGTALEPGGGTVAGGLLGSEGGAEVGTAAGAGAGAAFGYFVCASGGGGSGGSTVHGSNRARERNFTQADIAEAKKTATETGNVTTQIGKYGTPQKVYNGTNGLTVVEETAGRNAGKIITGWWR